jgi:hypothetical protein
MEGSAVINNGSGVRAEFERTTKMGCENESENDHVCKVRRLDFSKMIIFGSFSSHSQVHF